MTERPESKHMFCNHDYRHPVYGCKVYSVSSTQDIEVDHGENTEGTS